MSWNPFFADPDIRTRRFWSDRFWLAPVDAAQGKCGCSLSRSDILGLVEQRVAAQLGKILCPVVPKAKEQGLAHFEQALVN